MKILFTPRFNYLLDEIPPMRDCKEIFDNGFTRPGFYYIDPSGGGNQNARERILCDGKWNIVLHRTAPDASGNAVIIAHRARVQISNIL